MEPVCIICLAALPSAEPSNVDDTSPDSPSDENPRENVDVSPASKVEVAHLQNCRHSFHDHCLAVWIEVANTCPACRATFNQVDISDTIEGLILRSYPVADKVQAATHDEDVPPEETEEYDESHWRCIICGRADQEDVLLLCDNCNDAYHTHCLDIDGIPEGDWFCPNCINFTNLDFTTRNFPAPGQRTRTAIQAVLHPTSRGRRGSRRRQLQQQQWDRAWARMRDRAWEQLDADVREDEASTDGQRRGLTARQNEERIR